jgi:hypothetical protein
VAIFVQNIETVDAANKYANFQTFHVTKPFTQFVLLDRRIDDDYNAWAFLPADFCLKSHARVILISDLSS